MHRQAPEWHTRAFEAFGKQPHRKATLAERVSRAGAKLKPRSTRMKVLYFIGAMAMLLFGLPSLLAGPTPVVTEPTPAPVPTALVAPVDKPTWPQAPALAIDPAKTYTATIETDKGTITAELYAKDAPKTVNNFVFLAKQGFYDGLTFHRVLPNFMAQGGDPKGDGTGGPGYTFEDEFSPAHPVDEGVLAMANAGPNTNGSQFFITYSAQPQLNDKHTVFGKVTSGLDVAKQLIPRDPQTAPQYLGDAIKHVTITEGP